MGVFVFATSLIPQTYVFEKSGDAESQNMKTGSDTQKELIINSARELNIDISPEQAELFALHADLLIKWNQKINLTGITDPLEIAIKHFIDSIIPLPFIPKNRRVLDIGSGGGFPGIPLKVLLHSTFFTLIDSSRKKNSFQKHVIRRLNIKKIEAFHVRAEDLSKQPTSANKYNVIICRALTGLDKFILMAAPLIAKKGRIIAMKGKPDSTEIESVKSILKTEPHRLGFNHDHFCLKVKKYTLPYIKAKRSLLTLDLTI